MCARWLTPTDHGLFRFTMKHVGTALIVLALAASSLAKYCADGCGGCKKNGGEDRYYRPCRECNDACPDGYYDFDCQVSSHCQ